MNLKRRTEEKLKECQRRGTQKLNKMAQIDSKKYQKKPRNIDASTYTEQIQEIRKITRKLLRKVHRKS